MTSGVQAALFDAIESAADLIESQAVADSWENASALDGMSVGEVAGHLTSTALATLRYLDVVADGEVGDRGSYYGRGAPPATPSPPPTGMLERARAIAARGPADVATTLRDGSQSLRRALDGRDPDDPISVMNDRVLRLDDYIETRVVEAIVHLDDLAASVGETDHALPESAVRVAVEHLVEVAIFRSGATDVLRALSRSERAKDGVLPVL